jgi:dienelactone hydrolase
MASAYPLAMVNIPVGGAAVPAALYEPVGKGPFAAVVMLSGCAGVNPDAALVARVNADYLAKGIATLVVDSFTARGIAEVCSNLTLLMDSIAFRDEDARAAVAWLGARPEIDARRIFLQGYSHGAQTAIAAIVNQRPLPQGPRVAGVIAYYPYCSTGSRFSVPTLILIGEKDDWTPAALCQGIDDKTNAEVVVYPDAAHAYASPGLDMLYLGHRLRYDAAATQDGQRRALAMILASGH